VRMQLHKEKCKESNNNDLNTNEISENQWNLLHLYSEVAFA